jgi:hypothetical protein
METKPVVIVCDLRDTNFCHGLFETYHIIYKKLFRREKEEKRKSYECNEVRNIWIYKSNLGEEVIRTITMEDVM